MSPRLGDAETPSVTETDPADTPLRVLVLDPDQRVRDSLAGLLCIGHRCVVVGTAADPADAMSQLSGAESAMPDVVIVDARLPDDPTWPTLLAALRRLDASPRVVVMGSDATEGTAVAAGADGFIRKTFRARELIDAVVAAGRPRLA
jgi:DNA-binding NarL/FixJ family response regulator